jgi:hypothetical protein
MCFFLSICLKLQANEGVGNVLCCFEASTVFGIDMVRVRVRVQIHMDLIERSGWHQLTL